jgi:retron-type reverse transcriptase
VQAAVKIVIEPIFEADFRDCSFGFRPRRSARDARDCLRRHVQRERRHVVVDADIEGFFDNLDRGILMRELRTRISDRRVLGLIECWLRSGVFADGVLLHPATGTPQGGVISPLLANVYLNGLERAFEERHARLGRLVRHANHLVAVCFAGRHSERMMAWPGNSRRSVCGSRGPRRGSSTLTLEASRCRVAPNRPGTSRGVGFRGCGSVR